MVSYEKVSCVAHIKHITHLGTLNLKRIIIDSYFNFIYKLKSVTLMHACRTKWYFQLSVNVF